VRLALLLLLTLLADDAAVIVTAISLQRCSLVKAHTLLNCCTIIPTRCRSHLSRLTL